MASGEDRAPGAARRVVVTGGAGFLGSQLCRSLLGRGDEVVCVDDLSTGRRRNLPAGPRIRLVEADVADGLPDVDGELLIHLAGPADHADYLLSPLAATRAIVGGALAALRHAREHGMRLVLVSSGELYGRGRAAPFGEHEAAAPDPGDPANGYLYCRLFAESLAATHRDRYGVEVAIARVFASYGPRMRPDTAEPLARFVGQAVRGLPITVPAPATAPHPCCYVGDVADGILRLASSGVPGPVNLGAPSGPPIAVLAERVVALAGSGAPIRFDRRGAPALPPRRPDVTLAERLLDWRPSTPLETGIGRMLEEARDREPVAV